MARTSVASQMILNELPAHSLSWARSARRREVHWHFRKRFARQRGPHPGGSLLGIGRPGRAGGAAYGLADCEPFDLLAGFPPPDLAKGKNPPSPEHAVDSWPGSVYPADEDEWKTAVSTFLSGLRIVEEIAASELEQEVPGRAGKSRGEILGKLTGHNSYHLGQIVLLRRLLGSWSPPSGGDTW